MLPTGISWSSNIGDALGVVSVPIEANIDAEIGRRCGLTQRQAYDSPELGAWAHRAPREAPGHAR